MITWLLSSWRWLLSMTCSELSGWASGQSPDVHVTADQKYNTAKITELHSRPRCLKKTDKQPRVQTTYQLIAFHTKVNLKENAWKIFWLWIKERAGNALKWPSICPTNLFIPMPGKFNRKTQQTCSYSLFVKITRPVPISIDTGTKRTN